MFYKNIAEIYAQSRPPYPKELFKIIMSYVRNDHRKNYVDLGCGTGELLFPLSTYFDKSTGVDVDEDMLHVAAKKMKKLSAQNVTLVKKTAEEYLKSLPQNIQLDLVTAGRSFHWMDQQLVTRQIYQRLPSGGVFVTLGEVSGGIWRRETLWARSVRDIIFKQFSHKPTFIPARGHRTSIEKIKQNLETQPFSKVEDVLVETKQQWKIDTIINLFYSASGFLEWLGDDKEEFEEKVKNVLLKINPSGTFEDISQFGMTLCIK